MAESVLVVVKTDAYASRGWCQRELLDAKRAGRTVVILDAVREGEARSFPYLGNARSLRVAEPTPAALTAVVQLALDELLRHAVAGRALEAWSAQQPERPAVRPLPPELLTVGDDDVVVYPDPPLTRAEQAVLEGRGVRAVTPSSLHRLGAPVRVALSVSESADLADRGFGAIHLRDASVELARLLLNAGCGLAYGGDLRQGGFSELLTEIARSWGRWRRDDDDPVEGTLLAWHLAWPFHLGLSRSEELDLLPDIRVLRGPAPEGVNPSDAPDRATEGGRRAVAQALTAMRRDMVAATGARVILGGRTTGSLGDLPGVLEEAELTLQAGQPLYLLGAFGGCAAIMVEAVRGAAPPADLDARAHAALAGLGRAGWAGLRNGLDDDECERLAVTPHVEEAAALILRGLKRGEGTRGDVTGVTGV